MKKIQCIGEGQWQDVPTRVYKEEDSHYRDIVRRTLLKDVPGFGFEIRYFEIDRNGYSSLEIHEHTHTVIINRGRGRAVVGEQVYPAAPGDIFLVQANEPHQFIQEGDEPFGFYCIVPAERDRPRLLDAAEKEALRAKVAFQD